MVVQMADTAHGFASTHGLIFGTDGAIYIYNKNVLECAYEQSDICVYKEIKCYVQDWV